MKATKPTAPTIQRQGDVLIVSVTKLPDGCVEIQPDAAGRLVLAYGEATGHAHAIQVREMGPQAADEITEALIARCRLYRSPAGDRYLVVDAPVQLLHEEHTQQDIGIGIYEIPAQMEYDASTIRRVAD